MKITKFIILALFLVGCSKEREAPNGLKIRVLRQGSGEFAKPGEFLVTIMVIKDAKDSVWKDTRKENLPMIIPVGETSSIAAENGVESAFRVLKKGDSVEVDVKAVHLFGQEPLPPSIKPDDLITFTISVDEITDSRGANTIYQELQAREAEMNRKKSEGQLTLDTVAIDAYLATNKIKADKDPSGLRYVIKKLGKGEKPNISSTVTVYYKGTFLDNGEVFDESKPSLEYPLNGFITGWQIGFLLLPKGSKATFYIPSTLGYGITGYPPGIPPNANLVFEVELIDFK